MRYTEHDWQQEMELWEGELCKHSVFGSCVIPCPWCGVTGFYSPRLADERHYRMCKWCGKVQDVGGKVNKCVIEICRKCHPSFDGTFPKGFIPPASDDGSTRFTINPGHPCGICQTTMAVLNPKANPMQPVKDELYEIHGYK